MPKAYAALCIYVRFGFSNKFQAIFHTQYKDLSVMNSGLYENKKQYEMPESCRKKNDF